MILFQFILSSIANAMEIGTVVDVLGPMLFNRFSVWDLMLKKARLTYNVHAMDAVVRDTESILLELKLLLENCFDHLEESESMTCFPICYFF